MKNILLFGAGKSATVLIHYLLEQCHRYNWQLTVVDANLELAQQKLAQHPAGRAFSFDVTSALDRMAAIAEANMVISLLPPSLHLLVAKDCVAAGKNLLTASYIDAGIEALRPHIEAKGLLFLCEMGLDPGIDHMSAKKLLDGIVAKGGTVVSFISHCGGLVAPQSDDNPWHYKISWNPRNVVLAGKDGSIFREAGETITWPYETLFTAERPVDIAGATYCWYPNRDSLRYLPLYGLEQCSTFIRTTLRHPDFIFGWKHLIELGLTDTEPRYETDGMSLQQFFREHFDRVDFDSWLQHKLAYNLAAQDRLLDPEFEAQSNHAATAPGLAQQVQQVLYRSGLLLDQLSWLGINDGQTLINKGRCSAADVLQLILEQKLSLQPGDRDLVVMQHEIRYQKEGSHYLVKSCLSLEGKDDAHTAMAATVGLPLGMAATLMLLEKLPLTGLHIPILPQIYEPILALLQEQGIAFIETENEV
jgi:saccharopine dehydrogenase-like NADP-dependent oxidoreductase